jgi:hypothetical protein
MLLKDLTNMHVQQKLHISPNGRGTLAFTTSHSPNASQRPKNNELQIWDGLLRIRMVAGLAVLSILLALGALAMRPERSAEPPAIPAAVMEDDSGIESETLLDISFPAGRMRGDEGAQLIFGENKVPAGSEIGFRISCDSHDIHPFYVIEGTLAAEVAGTSFVLRAGASTWETIPAGQTAEVQTGDTWYYENFTKDGMTNLRNPGPEDLRYMWVGVRQNSSRCNQSPPSGQQDVWHYLEDPTGALDPTQPVRLVLRTVTIPVGSVIQGELGGFPIPSAEQEAMGARQWARILSGSLSITRKFDGEEDSTMTWPRYMVVTQLVTRSDVGEQVTIDSSESDGPVELMVLDIIVGDPWAQGGVAGPPAASPVASPVAND